MGNEKPQKIGFYFYYNLPKIKSADLKTKEWKSMALTKVIYLNISIQVCIFEWRVYYAGSCEYIGITYQNDAKNIGYWMENLATTFCSGVAKLATQIRNLAPAQPPLAFFVTTVSMILLLLSMILSTCLTWAFFHSSRPLPPLALLVTKISIPW